MDELYFNWLCNLVYTRERPASRYSLLMRYLHNTPFDYILPLDDSRVADGISLRYRFTLSTGHSEAAVSQIDDHDWCSMLEMLVALSFRCEEDIVGDPNNLKVYHWVWVMLENCGLAALTNDIFDKEIANAIVDKVIHRKYDADGYGGLFYIPNCKQNLLDLDIWYQLNWYLNYIMRGES